jgi:hypothetical protein
MTSAARNLVACVVLITFCAWWYVRTVLSLPGLVGYEAEWRFQLLMFAIFRLPVVALALAIIGLAWHRLRRVR